MWSCCGETKHYYSLPLGFEKNFLELITTCRCAQQKDIKGMSAECFIDPLTHLREWPSDFKYIQFAWIPPISKSIQTSSQLWLHIWIATDKSPMICFQGTIPTLPTALFILPGLDASSKAIQQNGKLNFKESGSMGRGAYRSSQTESIEVHSLAVATQAGLTSLWLQVPEGDKDSS